ncbi:hypothetical protein [Paenibacillus sp. TC-CSREp1]|uniref:hypothetical protein n=1 Tax=Paenibacillus sp. TC-CSREp1 TaxID=3410089 RepID=UPI003CFD9ED6
MKKRDIQTVPAFLREGGDGLLSLEHHHFPQTSTIVPFEGNVGEAAGKTKWAERTRRSEAFAFTTGFPPLEGE